MFVIRVWMETQVHRLVICFSSLVALVNPAKKFSRGHELLYYADQRKFTQVRSI